MTRRSLTRSALLLFALTGMPRIGAAQRLPADSIRLVRIAGAYRGRDIRIHPVGRERMLGRVTRIEADSIVLYAGTGTWSRLAMSEIDSLWTRDRPVLRYAAGGALVTALPLMGLAYLLGGLCSEVVTECGAREQRRAAAEGAILGVLVGGTTGAIVGAMRSKWRLRFP
jgi:hypothetical protein